MSDYKKIAVIGNYLPRRCGIATFTTDLCNAIAGEMEDEASNLVAIAMDDVEEGYDYSDRVKFQVKANVLSDYLCAADFLNLHKFDVAVLQHEFGIFGGSYGAHIIHMVKNLRMPVITTLHTILENPTEEPVNFKCYATLRMGTRGGQIASRERSEEITLVPGEEYETKLTFTRTARLEPGEYKVTADLTGISFDTNSETIEIRKPFLKRLLFFLN